MGDNKRKLVVIILLIIGIILLSGTFAFWSWITSDEQKTNVVFTVAKNFSCAADGGGNITSDDTNVKLAPSICTDPNRAIQRTVVVTPKIDKNDLTINMDLWLDINSIGAGLTNSKNFKYALTTSSTSCTEGIISSGDFFEKNEGEQVNLLNKSYSDSLNDTYYLYIWLDKVEESDSTMNQKFDFALGGSCTDYNNKPEAPVLDDGMIPVTISDDGTVRTVSSDDNDWYNYDEKKWANVVLVNENATENVEGSKSRQEYLTNLSNNIEVNESDILAYYVWIPRYKYKIPYKKCSEIPVADRNMEDYPECYAPYTMSVGDKQLLTEYFLNELHCDKFDAAYNDVLVLTDYALRTGRFSNSDTFPFDSEYNTSIISWVKAYNSGEVKNSGCGSLPSGTLILNHSNFNGNNTLNGYAVSIDIAFEDANADISYGNAQDTYYTHPAFWWDNNSDRIVNKEEILAGIWVGKFETSPDPSSACYTSPDKSNCNNSVQSPRILPNVVSLRYQAVGYQFLTSRNFSKSGNIYGLFDTGIDSHLMKNSEWGAIAYLTHSKYGVNNNVYFNNSTQFITGRSSGTFYNSTSTNSYGSYTWLGETVSSDGTIGFINDDIVDVIASTTGNVTGIYDIAGASWERIMGFLIETDDSVLTGIDKKYYNGYSLDHFYATNYALSNMKLCTLETCGGHALLEVNGWYGYRLMFAGNLSFPVFVRGGSSSGSGVPDAGLFSLTSTNGGAGSDVSWRSVLIIN